MLSILAALTLAVAPRPMLPDTPPPLPIPVERLGSLKSNADIVAASRLANGRPAPADMVLPVPQNSNEILKYMLDHYPNSLRDRYDFEMPWAWMLIDQAGRSREAHIVKSSGAAAFDTLSLAALRVARFTPARVRGKAVAVWVPMPIQASYAALAARAPKKVPQPPPRNYPSPNEPAYTPYTVRPELLNRDEVRRALARNYPPDLSAAGVGGKVSTWVFIDETGQTLAAQLRASSGNSQLDSAGLVVARGMRFSPAKHGDVPVAVWVQIPVVFRAR